MHQIDKVNDYLCNLHPPVDGARAIPQWRHKPEVVFRMGSRCRRRVFQIAVDHPRLAQSLGISSTAPVNYFRFGAARWIFEQIVWPTLHRSQFVEKTPPAHLQALHNTTPRYDPPRLQIVENDWTDVT